MGEIRHEMVQMLPNLPFKFYDKDPKLTVVAPHWHRGLELNYLVSGGPLTVVEDGVSTIFTPGAMWTIDPRVVHNSRVASGASLREFGLIIDPTFLESALPDSVNWHFTLHGVPANPAKQPAYQALQASFTAFANAMLTPASAVNRLVVLSHFYALLAQLVTHFTTTKVMPAVRVNPPLVDQAMSLIDRDYAQPLTAGDVAQALHVSLTTLNEQFQASLQRSVNGYLHQVRLMKARELLLTSNKPIAYVAAATGFGTPRGLTRNFKAWKGLTPSAYRQAFKQYHKNDRIYF